MLGYLRTPLQFDNMKKVSGKKLYSSGGEISQLAPLLGSAANLAIPGVGAIATPMLELVGNWLDGRTDNKLALKQNSKVYALGGKLEGELGPGMSEYAGPQHKFGGIMVTKTGTPAPGNTGDNVEGGEVLVTLPKLGVHVFSKRLKVGK